MEIQHHTVEQVEGWSVGRLDQFEGFASPLVITPTGDADLRTWFEAHRPLIKEELHRSGAMLFRDWRVDTAADFYEVMSALSDQTLDYTQRTSPRSQVINKVYTSTDYPPDQEIQPHNESSYASTWPLVIAFFCLTEPATGGETPITDNREMVKHLSQRTIDLLEKKGVSYTRNMLDWLGLSWQEVYQTDDKSKVEALLKKDGMQFQWVDESHLRVSWQRPAFQTHPVLQTKGWFNHAYFYHRLNQDPRLLDLVEETDLPFIIRMGDQSEITESIYQELKQAYQAATITFPWKKGDVLILDNMLFSHARRSFTGQRKILVSMAEPVRYEQLVG